MQVSVFSENKRTPNELNFIRLLVSNNYLFTPKIEMPTGIAGCGEMLQNTLNMNGSCSSPPTVEFLIISSDYYNRESPRLLGDELTQQQGDYKDRHGAE